MKKIKWKPKGSNKYARAEVGCVVIHINLCYTNTKFRRWYADVSLQKGSDFRIGPTRKSMDKAKDDAVRLAREILLDYRTAVEKELANFE